jgi:hypothetical protein
MDIAHNSDLLLNRLPKLCRSKRCHNQDDRLYIGIIEFIYNGPRIISIEEQKGYGEKGMLELYATLPKRELHAELVAYRGKSDYPPEIRDAVKTFNSCKVRMPWPGL